MHDFELVLEEFEPLDDALGAPTQHILRHVAPGNVVQRAGVHVLHAIVDARLDEESAVEVDDVRRGCSMENVELGDDRLEFRVIELESNLLQTVARTTSQSEARRKWCRMNVP